MERLPRRTPAAQMDIVGLVLDALAEMVEGIPIIGDIVGFVASLFGNSSASNARIARLETIVSKGSSGYDDFNRSDSGSLGRGPQMTVDWVTGGDGQALGVQGRAAGLVEALAPADGRRWARYPTPASSSTMTADTIVDDKKVDSRACTSVIVAANAAFTEFVYANVFGTGVYLGRGTRSGNSWSFNDWKSNTSYKVGTAERVEVRASGSGIYQLVVDNTVILEHTDSTYPIDADHRYVGFAIQCWTGILQLPEYGWRLSAFSLKSEAGTFTAIESVETIANGAATVANGAQTQAGIAGQTAVAASANAATARTEASQALTAAQSVEATAQEALATADIAYENAQYWKDECVVASAEVLLGVNELLIGIVMDVPTGRTRFLTDLHFAFSAQPGTIVIQTRVVAADGVTLRTAHTATITANQVRRSYNNLGVQVYDKERVFWNVVSSTSPATVLQVALVGVLTPAVTP